MGMAGGGLAAPWFGAWQGQGSCVQRRELPAPAAGARRPRVLGARGTLEGGRESVRGSMPRVRNRSTQEQSQKARGGFCEVRNANFSFEGCTFWSARGSRFNPTGLRSLCTGGATQGARGTAHGAGGATQGARGTAHGARGATQGARRTPQGTRGTHGLLTRSMVRSDFMTV